MTVAAAGQSIAPEKLLRAMLIQLFYSVRSEHAFARLTHQGGKCLRTIGLARARVVIGLKVAMHNLLLMAWIAQLGTGAPA